MCFTEQSVVKISVYKQLNNIRRIAFDVMTDCMDKLDRYIDHKNSQNAAFKRDCNNNLFVNNLPRLKT